MNKQTKTFLGIAALAAIGYYIWKQSQKSKGTMASKPGEEKKGFMNVAGGPGMMLPKGSSPVLLQSSPGVCGWYYEDPQSPGNYIFIAPGRCPKA